MFALILMGCNPPNQNAVIISKSYLTGSDKPMPDGICRYVYRSNQWTNDIEFQDSCWKYNIGDTIIGRAKK